MPLSTPSKTRLWLFRAWLVGFTALTFYALHENRDRIDDIQQARLESCIHTYEGVRQVFLPFFPPAPRTKEQQENWDKFSRTVNDLKAQCGKQTQTEEE